MVAASSSEKGVPASSMSDAVRLNLSGKAIFVGRDDEIKLLQDAMERITDPDRSGVQELVLIGGVAGTGKSSLVKVALENCTQVGKGGFFIHGKCDQLSHDGRDAFSAILQALGGLCRAISLHENKAAFVKTIQETLGNEIGRLSTFVPELRTLGIPKIYEDEVECQWAVGEQGTSYDRFVTLCNTFLHSLATPATPIALFIDDLHWGDVDSFKLIRSLLLKKKGTSGLLIVGAYRDDEDAENHSLATTFEQVKASGVKVSTIRLRCLDENSVNKLVAFVTELQVEETQNLSQLIHRKTRGNCFFVIQFLEMLQDCRLLRFSFASYKWEWGIDEIAARTSVSDNVVDLVIQRISKLDLKTKEIFNIASCLGGQFTREVLNLISCSRSTGTFNDTIPGKDAADVAVNKLISLNLLEASRGQWLKFSHCRIQQVAESYIGNAQKREELCLEIGRILKSKFEADADRNEWLFFAVIDLLNKGSQLISSRNEKLELAAFNRRAASKATDRSAFLLAARYTEAAIALLGKSSWIDNPHLTMELHDDAAKSYIKCGRSESTYDIASTMVMHSSNEIDRLRGQYIQMESLEVQRRFDEGIALGFTMMISHHVRFPTKPSTLRVIRGVLRTKRLLGRHTDNELLNLPAMTDEAELRISKMEFHIIRIMFHAKNKDVMPLLFFRTIRQALKFGMSPYACTAFVSFGNLLGHLNDSRGATRLGRLSLLMCQKYGLESVHPSMDLAYYYMSHHWRNPIQTAIDPLAKAYVVGMKVGDVQMALIGGLAYCVTYLNSGLHLDVLAKDLSKFTAIIEEYSLKIVRDQITPIHQLVLNLTGGDDLVTNPVELTGRLMNEELHLHQLQATGSLYAEYITHTMKLRALVFLGREASVEIVDEYRTIRSKRFDKEIRADFGARQDEFYGALAAIATYKESGRRWQLRLARRLVKQMETFVKNDAINCVHMLLLLKAEMLTCKKGAGSAVHTQQEIRQAFDNAINSASRSGFCQNAGLANERAALYCSGTDVQYANDYWQNAFEYYRDYGAMQKLEQLSELHPYLQAHAKESQRNGRANARSRYEEGVEQHKSLEFW